MHTGFLLFTHVRTSGSHRCVFDQRIWLKIDGFHWFRWGLLPRMPGKARTTPTAWDHRGATGVLLFHMGFIIRLPGTPIWVWVKNRYPKWNPGKWKQGLKPAVPGGCILTRAHLFFRKVTFSLSQELEAEALRLQIQMRDRVIEES